MIGYLVLQLFLIFVCVSSDDCTTISSSTTCSSTTGCKWVENNSNVSCTNIDFGCKNFDQKTCLNNKSCKYTPSMTGGCQLDRSVSCSNQSFIQCSYLGQRCSWQSVFKCENFSDGFNCDSKNQQQCVNSSNYCTSNFQCQPSRDQTLCSFKNKDDCLSSNSYCSYSITTAYSCKDSTSYCKNLSGPDCLADSNFCSFQQVTPSSCTNKSDTSICGKLSLSDCAAASQFCYQIQTAYSCTNIVSNATCGNLLDQASCILNTSCSWINSICSVIVDCTSLTQNQCESSQYTPFCKSNPSQTVCQNKSDFGCSNYSNQSSVCLQYSSYCSYQEFTGNCSSKNNCQNLNQTQCLSVSNKCTSQLEVGTCQLSNNINCNISDQQTCLSTSYCVYQFLSCDDLTSDLCSAFTIDQCSSNNTFCQAAVQGTCTDNSSLNCQQYSQQNCSQKQGCVYYSDSQESCSDYINCSKLSQEDCISNSKYCSQVSINGYCTADQTQVAQKYSVFLKINTLMLFVFLFLFQ